MRGLYGRKVRVEFYESGQLKKPEANTPEANTADDVSTIIKEAHRLGEPRRLKSPK